MEIWDLYDINRVKIDKKMKRGEPVPDGLYRCTVHLCIFNSKGEMLIQKRQPFKSGWSGMWDVTAGGSFVSGETSAVAMERELAEELGLELSFEGIRPAFTLNYKDGFGDVYILTKDVDLGDLKLQESEVADVTYASIDRILQMIDDDEFIPYCRSFVEFLFFAKDHDHVHAKPDKTLPKTI